MPQATGVPVELARAPLRTVRVRDVTAYAHPRAQLVRLQRRGVMHRLADGFYTVVPQERVGETWLPTLEGAAAGIAAAEFGERRYALMGLSAARMHRVLPRALAVAFVASPRRRQSMHLTDRDAVIHFRPRDMDLVHVELMRTDLGDCLVTTPEQTVLDLAHLPRGPVIVDDVHEAIRTLLPRCDDTVLFEIAERQRLRRALAYVRRVMRTS